MLGSKKNREATPKDWKADCQNFERAETTLNILRNKQLLDDSEATAENDSDLAINHNFINGKKCGDKYFKDIQSMLSDLQNAKGIKRFFKTGNYEKVYKKCIKDMNDAKKKYPSKKEGLGKNPESRANKIERVDIEYGMVSTLISNLHIYLGEKSKAKNEARRELLTTFKTEILEKRKRVLETQQSILKKDYFDSYKKIQAELEGLESEDEAIKAKMKKFADKYAKVEIPVSVLGEIQSLIRKYNDADKKLVDLEKQIEDLQKERDALKAAGAAMQQSARQPGVTMPPAAVTAAPEEPPKIQRRPANPLLAAINAIGETGSNGLKKAVVSERPAVELTKEEKRREELKSKKTLTREEKMELLSLTLASPNQSRPSSAPAKINATLPKVTAANLYSNLKNFAGSTQGICAILDEIITKNFFRGSDEIKYKRSFRTVKNFMDKKQPLMDFLEKFLKQHLFTPDNIKKYFWERAMLGKVDKKDFIERFKNCIQGYFENKSNQNTFKELVDQYQDLNISSSRSPSPRQ